MSQARVVAGRGLPAVLHLAAPARHGGLERVLVELGRGQAERDHRVVVALVLEPGDEIGHPLLEALSCAGVVRRTLVVPSNAYLQERRLVRALLEEVRPDVLHTHGYRPDVVDSGLAHGIGAVSVTTAHGFIGSGWRSRVYHGLQIRAARKMDGVIAVSETLARRFREGGVDQERLYLVPNGIGVVAALPREEARARLGIPDGAFAIGWIGRVSREKGGDVFLDALSRTPAGLRGVVIGGGPEKESLENAARSTGLAERVIFTGALSDASTYLSAFDVFALTSRTEGTPMALLEAMSAGLPVVATAVGGVPTVLSGGGGVLVPPERPQEIADAFVALAASREERERLGRAAQENVTRRFGLDQWTEEYNRIYRECLGRRRGRTR